MKQIVSNYSYSPTANCVTLTGLNIDQDQLLLIVAPGVGRTLYNFASVTGSVIAGTNTRINLTASTAGLTTTSPLVIYYDDQSAAQSVTGTVALDPASLIALENITVTVGSSVSISNLPATQTIAGAVTANDFSEWQEISTRDWKADQSDWIVNVSQYSAVRLYIDGDNTASISNGFWIKDVYDTYCEADYIIWNGRSSVNSFPLADCTPVLDANVHYNYVRFTGSEPMSGATTRLYGKKTRILDGLTNYQLRQSPVGVSGTVTASVSGSVNIAGSQYQSGNEDENYKFVVVGASQNSTNILRPLNVDSGQRLIVSTVTIGSLPAISGTVTASVINSVTVGSLPVQLSTTTIGGTARLNVTLSSATTVGNTAPSYANLYGGSDGTNLRAILTDTSGRTVVTGAVGVSGTVTANVTNSVTVGAIIGPAGGSCLQAISGSGDAVRIVLQGRDSAGNYAPIVGSGLLQYNIPIYGTVTIGNSVTISALPSGALTTRFGSVTTANTAQITSAVTNTSRKYLLAQNISAGTVTIGIGFAPTTTQGIQLTAGAGITFDTFCPTGAVYWLGATTGATWTILEN